jgi:hypothetical protein
MTGGGDVGGGDDDDGSFEFYQVNTTSHGPALLIGTFLFSVALYALLPFMVQCSKRREEVIKARRRAKRAVADYTDDDDFDDHHPHIHDDDDDAHLSVDHHQHHGGGEQQQPQEEVEISFSVLQLQIPPTPPPPSVANKSVRSSNYYHNRSSSADWEMSSAAGGGGGASSVWSSPSNFIHNVLANTHNAGRHGINAQRMYRRNIEMQAMDPESKEFTALVQRVRADVARQRGQVGSNFSDVGVGRPRNAAAAGGAGGPRTVASYTPGETPRSSANFGFSDDGIFPVPRRAGGAGAALAVSDLGSDIGSDAYLDPYYYRNNSKISSKHPKSVSSASVVSEPQQQQHPGEQPQKDQEKALSKDVKNAHPQNAATNQNNGCCGWGNSWDSLLQTVEWDHENKRLFTLAVPYTSQAIVAGIAEAARVAVIGKFYGTRELSAYVIVVRASIYTLSLFLLFFSYGDS